METIKDRKWLQILLSILAAIALWAYVGKVVNPEREATIRNIPVTFVGAELLEERGLMITRGADQTVTIDVQGKRDIINQLSAETVSVTVDVSTISQAGTYTQAYNIAPNLSGVGAASSFLTTERHPLNVEFTVSKLAARTIPVQGSFTGSVAEGYQAGSFIFAPSGIEVKGEESVINQIEYAKVVLDQEDLSETFSGDLPYTFITYAGTPLEDGEVSASTTLVRATLPVVQLKEVELAVNFLPGGGITKEDIDRYVDYKITPETIVVSGAADDLEPLKQISLGDIDLSKVIGNDSFTFAIPLAAELTNVSGVSEATVKVTIKGLTTATLEVDNIELINRPEGYTAQSVTQSRQVQIRGTKEAVESVTQSQLRIVADLGQAVAATGTQTVPARVYLDGRSDVGVVGDYNIVVSISR